MSAVVIGGTILRDLLSKKRSRIPAGWCRAYENRKSDVLIACTEKKHEGAKWVIATLSVPQLYGPAEAIFSMLFLTHEHAKRGLHKAAREKGFKPDGGWVYNQADGSPRT